MESELPLEELLKDYRLDTGYFASTTSQPDQSSTTNTNTNLDDVESNDQDDEDDDDDEDDLESKTVNDQASSDDYSMDEDEEEDEEDNDTGLEKMIADDDAEKTKTAAVTDDVAESKSPAIDDDSALASIAQQAQSLQPTGYTLETTNVTTPLPTLLLKHTLREYQHVGLDWLVTMHENKLNGKLT